MLAQEADYLQKFFEDVKQRCAGRQAELQTSILQGAGELVSTCVCLCACLLVACLAVCPFGCVSVWQVVCLLSVSLLSVCLSALLYIRKVSDCCW